MLHLNKKGLLKDHYHLWIPNYVKLAIENQCGKINTLNAVEILSPNWKLNPWRITSHRSIALHFKKNPSKFGDTIKPFMTNKSKICNNKYYSKAQW